jgi:hypothetical protein
VRNARAVIVVLVFALNAFAVTVSARAGAGEMSPTPERLVLQPPNLPPGQTCQSIAQNPGAAVSSGLAPQNFPCRPNNAAFANMVSELGFAIAPSAFYPARTTGVGGFQVSFEASYTRISAGRSVQDPDGSRTRYWELGTRGPEGAQRNAAPDSLLQIYAIKARKGLPYGLELAGSFGTIANTSLWVGGGDLRWSLLEGFRRGALGVLPDISVGGGVRTVTGTSKFYLTTAGLDLRVSKPIIVADSAQVIPAVGFQRLYVFGDSNVVDATPNVDALEQCGYAGNNPDTGLPICRNKLPNGADANTDFANTFTFQKVRTHRNRGLVAVNYRYEALWLGSQIAFDLNDPKDENPGLVGSMQWTLSFEGGVFF